MTPFRDVMIAPDRPIADVLPILVRTCGQIALVAEEDGRLLGTVTDGDLRRAILQGVALDRPVSQIMNSRPHAAKGPLSVELALILMGRLDVRCLPVVDGAGRVVDLHFQRPFDSGGTLDNVVVLMAGGEGRRLRPLTETLPKPMLPVDGRPILEHTLTAFIRQGFRRFFFAVNYRADQIRAHFGDGAEWGVEIRYLEERDGKLGTAGALALLDEPPAAPFIVMNGDLLTKVDFRALIDFHVSRGCRATACVRKYEIEIPFGVMDIDGERVRGVTEKPVNHFFINAGIYVLDPSCLDLVPMQIAYDMPTLLQAALAAGDMVGSFPIHEYWIDIGRHADLEQARIDLLTA